MTQKNNLHCVETALNQGLDARLDARRRRIRRGQLHARLLFVRRSDGRSRFPHDGVSRSIGEALSCAEQNDQFLSGAWLQPEQDAVGRGLCSWASAHSGHVDARSRARARLHQAGDQQDRNGFLGHDRTTTFDIFEKRGSTQYIQKNQYK